MGLNDRVSSLREIGWNGGGARRIAGRAVVAAAAAVAAAASIVLFESPGMTGRSYTLNGPMPQPGRHRLQRSRDVGDRQFRNAGSCASTPTT